MAELISDNAEQRAFTAASMNTMQCKLLSLFSNERVLLTDYSEDTFSAWVPLVWFQQVHQPNGAFNSLPTP